MTVHNLVSKEAYWDWTDSDTELATVLYTRSELLVMCQFVRGIPTYVLVVLRM
jgi:hypothetical protein